jgi:hypothetical protein
MNKKMIWTTFFFILLTVFSVDSYAATTVEVTNTSLSSTQQNITFTIGLNTTTISAGQGVRISYNITNTDPYCTKNFDTSFCDQITANKIDLQTIRFWINDNITYQILSTSLYGLQNYSSYYDLTIPSIDSSCYDIKSELVYYDNNDVSIRFAASNIIQRGTCLARNQTDQACRYAVDCNETLFCSDTNDNSVLDTCKAFSASYGYLCEHYGIGTKERVSKADDECRFAYPGLKNKNLKDAMKCIYREDCVSNYCWDSNGNGTTVCNAAGTSGNSTGIIASDGVNCISGACFHYWKCYSHGSNVTIGGENYTCENGDWRKPVPTVDIKSEYRNVTYKFTYVWENSTHIVANVTFSNNESTTFTLINAYLFFGDGANTTRNINVDLTQGQSRTEQYTITKPSSPPRYYIFYTESLIKNATTYWWDTSDERCFDSVDNEVRTECIVIPPQWSNNQSSIVSTYSPTTLSHFNITWTDSSGISKVFIESNWSGYNNYSMGNSFGGNIYNYSVILPTGTFYWKSYANDTSNSWNASDTWYFTIGKATPTVTLQLNGSSSDQTYAQGEMAELTAFASDLVLTTTIYANFTGSLQQIASGTGTVINIANTTNLAIGYYLILANSTENANYTNSASVSYILRVVSAPYKIRISGYAFYSDTGQLIPSGTVIGIIKETGDSGTTTISNGYFNLLITLSTFDPSKNKFVLGLIINSTDQKFGYVQLISGVGNFISQVQTCSIKQWHFSGHATNPDTGLPISQGNITINIPGETVANTTAFYNGIWDIYYSPCLISGNIYTFQFIVTSGNKRSAFFMKQVAK